MDKTNSKKKQNIQKVKFSFIWNIESEAERILQTSYYAVNGFYSSKGFYVTDKRISGDPSGIYLPRLDFEKIPDYWFRVNLREMQFPLSTPLDLELAIEDLLKQIVKINKTKLKKFENDWKLTEKKFWDLIWIMFPQYKKLIGEIEICITSFGSLSSYGHLKKGQNYQKLRVYLREDFDISQVAEVIITGIFKNDLNEKGFTWENRESITDFLMQLTPLYDLFPKYKPTLESLIIDPVKKSETLTYMSELGIPGISKLNIKNGDLWYANTCIEKKFSKSQASILKLMLNRRGEIILYEEIGDFIWNQKSTDKYSIWAINKHIQRIRDKLISLGIYNAVIESVRGRGYILSS